MKSKKKKSILKYTENFTKEELNIIKHNFLINPKNINFSEKELLLHCGLISKNITGNLYTHFDPLQVSTIGLSLKIFSLLSPCIHSVVSIVINKNTQLKKLIDKKFKRYINIEEDNDIMSDIIFQLKILKMIFNENFESQFKYLNKKKMINIINELIEFRNLQSHQVYKKFDNLKKIKRSKKNKRSKLFQINKLRNYNYIIKIINKSQYLLNCFYKNKDKITQNTKIINRNYVALENLKRILKDLCLIRERKKRLESHIKTDKELNDIAIDTINYLYKKLNSKSKKIRMDASRNIVNIILPRMESDTVLKNINTSLSNKSCKKYCKLL